MAGLEFVVGAPVTLQTCIL